MTYSFIIEGPPKVWQRVKRGKYGQIYDPNGPVKDGIAKTMLCARLGQCLTGPVGVHLRFYGLVKGDLDNAIKLILDAGNEVLWNDDRQITEIHAMLTRQDAKPRTEIEVSGQISFERVESGGGA